jgi:chitodextrinase
MSDFDNYLSPFPDIDLDSLEGKAAAELARREVIGGFPDGYFKGGEFVNRAQLAKFLILTRWGEMGGIADNGYFPDLVPGSWYISYVTTANALDIITGHPSGEFKPADYVQVSEFAKMFSKTFDLETDLSYSFLDVDSDAWYSKYVGIISYYDLMPYRGDYLYPSAYMTRDEVTVAIYQYLSNRSYSQSWGDSWEDENEDTENPSEVENVLLTSCFVTIFEKGVAPLETTFDPGCSTGTVTSYFWDFGDGNISTSHKPSHVFEEPGEYRVTLEVTDSDNTVDKSEVFIDVTGEEDE